MASFIIFFGGLGVLLCRELGWLRRRPGTLLEIQNWRNATINVHQNGQDTEVERIHQAWLNRQAPHTDKELQRELKGIRHFISSWDLQDRDSVDNELITHKASLAMAAARTGSVANIKMNALTSGLIWRQIGAINDVEEQLSQRRLFVRALASCELRRPFCAPGQLKRLMQCLEGIDEMVVLPREIPETAAFVRDFAMELNQSLGHENTSPSSERIYQHALEWLDRAEAIYGPPRDAYAPQIQQGMKEYVQLTYDLQLDFNISTLPPEPDRNIEIVVRNDGDLPQ